MGPTVHAKHAALSARLEGRAPLGSRSVDEDLRELDGRTVDALRGAPREVEPDIVLAPDQRPQGPSNGASQHPTAHEPGPFAAPTRTGPEAPSAKARRCALS